MHVKTKSVFVLLLLFSAGAQAQWREQGVSLEAGWNSVYLTVAPAPPSCDEIFGMQPRIRSVRKWCPRSLEDVLFDETEGLALPDGGSWLTWFPTNHPNRAMLDLSLVDAPGSYLIEVSSGAPFVFAIPGRPVAVSHTWRFGVDHFVGLPVPEAAVVHFSSFFEATEGDIPTAFQDGGEIYRLLPDGTYQRIFLPATADIDVGVAYWIRSQAQTVYTGPLAVRAESASGWFDFDRELVPRYLELENVTDSPRNVELIHETSAPPPSGEQSSLGNVPLKFAVVTPLEGVLGRRYEPLPLSWSTQLAARASIRLAFLPDAALLTGDPDGSYQSILKVSDDAAGTTMVEQRIGVRAASRLNDITEARGLWVGQATITSVGRLEMLGVKGAIPATPVPVSRPFSFRLLLHVDEAGTARLLQRVMVGTRRDPATGEIVTDLLADESAVAAYRGANPGAEVFRMSSANFPFMNPVALTGGTFGTDNHTLSCDVVMARDDPVNPFLHTYSPMHDNKEPRAGEDVPYDDDVEVFSTRRSIEFLFQPPDGAYRNPRWGASVCGGIYRESIGGLGGPLDATNRVIKVEGSFILEHAMETGVLTP